MMRLIGIGILLLSLSGCVMMVLSPDLSKANWFGCRKEERLKPTTRGMFGTNKGNAECLKPDNSSPFAKPPAPENNSREFMMLPRCSSNDVQYLPIW